ncbi:MAG: DUF4377 domain-containing protein, partial [Bacteroidia bacterium]|nr:DUF4377 domain-containing protein [Bacteroidia bacterium]
TGVGEMSCMQIQKGEEIEWNKWTLFYSSIQGFHYQPGFIYKLIIKEEHLDPASVPADASSIKYSLVKQLEKKNDTKFRIHDIWALDSIDGEKYKPSQAKHPTIEINTVENRFFGNDGCNNMFGNLDTLTNDELRFGMIGSTMMACMNMVLPDNFKRKMELVKFYEIKGTKLFLQDKNKETCLVMRKVD